jgi:rhodanese-related sulfurtransferase
MNDITVQELKDRMDAGTCPPVIDVRETWEFEQDHIEAQNIPLATVPVKIADLSAYKDQELVICCRSGGRSGQACAFLRAQGFAKVRNLTGGMLAWKANIDSAFNVQ